MVANSGIEQPISDRLGVNVFCQNQIVLNMSSHHNGFFFFSDKKTMFVAPEAIQYRGMQLEIKKQSHSVQVLCLNKIADEPFLNSSCCTIVHDFLSSADLSQV